jgi:hypothetical protein
MKKIDPKAYTEALEILKYIPDEYVRKIPRYLLISYEAQKDKEYNFNFNYFIPFEELDILPETKDILENIYINYWAKEEEKTELIVNKQIHDDNEKVDKNIDNLITGTLNTVSNDIINDEQANLPMVIKKENIFIRLVNYLKNLFKN